LGSSKISETRKPDCLCNTMKTTDHEQKLHLDSAEKPDVPKALGGYCDFGHLRGCSRQCSDLDDE
jgi:hypothetical protein